MKRRSSNIGWLTVVVLLVVAGPVDLFGDAGKNVDFLLTDHP